MPEMRKLTYIIPVFLVVVILVGFAISVFLSGSPEPAGLEGNATLEKIAAKTQDKLTTATRLTWDKPRFEQREKERKRMVKTQMSGFMRDPVENERVLEAMRAVPRHLFVPKSLRFEAYDDNPLPIGYGQTISQPYIVAYMTQVLQIKPGDKVLEIGTGSGYQAAVLSELTPHVYTIEIIKPLAESAKKRFKALGYDTIKAKQGDGYYGWEEYAPFDGIIVTAAAGHIPPPLIKQLTPGGRMVIPVGGPYEVQHLVVVSKSKDRKIRTRTVMTVRFVPMTGRAEKGKE